MSNLEIKYRGIEEQSFHMTGTLNKGSTSDIVRAASEGLYVKRQAGNKVECIFWGEIMRHLPTLLEGSAAARDDVRKMIELYPLEVSNESESHGE